MFENNSHIFLKMMLMVERGEEKPSLGLCSGIGLFYYNHHCIACFHKTISYDMTGHDYHEDNDLYIMAEGILVK